ncbi:allantoinase AllB [Pseudonocardia sp. RS11V-5]|uniref:allantoinase AllB n=1 Tax=Pseudonocardia terrae TaxID=2905831 RepID=UPI001E55C0EC|nr:allantoinase AllB [Pseudonocardia terrae]MCE3552791.1 allantoinase AllB [Pseudonocardia terrae]
MAEYDLVIRSPRVITRAGEVPRCVAVRDGVVVAIEPLDTALEGRETVDLAADEVLLPGLVDTHVHVNEPGRTEWEGYATATRAAAAGGVTTILDMPLNSLPPTCTVEALEIKKEAAAGKCHVDVGFWGGAIPGNLDDLRGLHDAGVFGFKCFMTPSGVDEFPPLDIDELERYLATLRSYGATMIVHAEDSTAIERAPAAHGRRYADFLASRPRGSENLAIAHLIEAARHTGATVHLLHLSSSDAVAMIRTARREGVAMTVETCPHYLVFEAQAVADGATQFKCCPPIREADNREALWHALGDGDIDCIVSDHSPCTPELKRLELGDFGEAWGGISSLQLGLAAVWTEARQRGYTLVDVTRWMAETPARIARLQHKGMIERGYHADFAVFAPDDAFVVDPRRLYHRNPVTPYAQRPLAGAVRSTWLRGQRVTGDRPEGRLISRGEA